MKEAKQRPVWVEWGITLLEAVVIALVVTQLIIVNGVVPTGSMQDTLAIGDRFIAFRWSYAFADPQRGDIAVFQSPLAEGEVLVKRIVAGPGDVLEIKEGELVLNGEETPELSAGVTHRLEENFGPITVPENSYFMMGDNRANSLDSRYWEYPFVSRDMLLGKVILKYYKGFEFLG